EQLRAALHLFRHDSRKHEIDPLGKTGNKPGIALRNRFFHFTPELLLHIGDPRLWNVPVPCNTTSFFSHKKPLLSAIFKPAYTPKIKDLISYVKEHTGWHIVFSGQARYTIMREGRVVPVYEEFTQNRIA